VVKIKLLLNKKEATEAPLPCSSIRLASCDLSKIPSSLSLDFSALKSLSIALAELTYQKEHYRKPQLKSLHKW